MELRAQAFNSIWAAKEAKLEHVLTEANSETVSKITSYIADTDPLEHLSQLPTGLVTSGLATSSSGSMYEPIARKTDEVDGCWMIRVSAADCSNLKNALKAIIRNGTGITEEAEDILDEDEPLTKRKTKLLNYDLEALEQHLRTKNASKCVLFFQNSEALDGQVLGDLVDVLCSWQDRIAFMILFEIAVSVELFQEKLPRNTVRQLCGTTFESKSASEILDLMFRAATSPDDKNPLYLGASTSKLLLDRQEEHIQSAKGFISALKYMYMMHFFNNSLSVLLSERFDSFIEPIHRTSVRRLKSFSHFITDLKDEDPARAEQLEHSDCHLKSELPAILSSSRTTLLTLLDALQTLHAIHAHSGSKQPLRWSTLYTKAMSGDLIGSPLYRELLLSVRKLSSDSMTALLSSLTSISSLKLNRLPSDLGSLLCRATKATYDSPDVETHLPILRSAYDPTQSTTRTTVISQRITLAKSQSTLSPLDSEYSRLTTQVHAHLRNYFTSALVQPREIPLYEVLVFDAKTAVTGALGAAPRRAMERAMERPGDYLDCECCRDTHDGNGVDRQRAGGQLGGLKASMPPTSVLWQLVQEAGQIVNVEDLWRAFETVIADEKAAEDKDDMTLALFYRALAELRYLGVVKGSRKRAGFVQKTRWKGL